MKLNISIGIIFMSLTWASIAQQEAHFTQFADNQLFINPAYAGSNGMLNATMLHREQWIGFTGNPRTSNFSLNTPLSYESVGVGISMVNDQIGPMTQTMFYGDFSYSLKFSNQSKLAFGVKAGMNMISLNTSTLNTTTENDQNLNKDSRFVVNPNLGFGVYYHSKKWFFGASSPRIVQSAMDNAGLNLEKRHLYANAGAVFTLTPTMKLRPIAQVKMTEGAPMSLDLSVTGIIKESLFLGAMYRLNAATGIFVQYQITPTFRFGVGTEIGLTQMRKVNDGTYEVMLTYDVSRKKSGIKSPRYF